MQSLYHSYFKFVPTRPLPSRLPGAAYFNSTAAVIAGAVHVTYYRGGPATHSYLDTRQTHQVMPLIAGVVPAAIVASVLTTLETEITVTQKGHVDTGENEISVKQYGHGHG